MSDRAFAGDAPRMSSARRPVCTDADGLPHYVSDAPFDPYVGRANDAGAGALLHGVAVADDVVEAAPPPGSRSYPGRSCWPCTCRS